MSRTVPASDSYTRLNDIESRLAALERQPLPMQFAFHANTVTATSASYATLAGSPSLTVTLGASGDAMVIMAANLGIEDVDDTAYLGLQVDGGSTEDIVWSGATASLIATSGCTVFSLSELFGSPLTPGSHTFTLRQRGSTNGHNFDFSGQALVIWPI